jgi:hypothetical protein
MGIRSIFKVGELFGHWASGSFLAETWGGLSESRLMSRTRAADSMPIT